MNDREALAAAVEALDREQVNDSLEYELVLFAAARKYLAQLPEKCGTCDGTGLAPTISIDGPTPTSGRDFCLTCHGTGKVYPAELVERIADAISHGMTLPGQGVGRLVTEPLAVAVLDALNGERVAGALGVEVKTS